MPHAEEDTMSGPTVNGEKHSSAFLSHLTSYPLVSDGISTFKANPYGQKSIDVADAGYAKFAKPVLPYLAKPYEFVSPYVTKADELADSGLTKVDEKFPIVKEETEKVKGTLFDYALFPVQLAGQGKEYVFSTYGDEYQRVGGKGIITTGKATVSTGLRITAETLNWLSGYLGPKKEAAKESFNDTIHEAKEKINDKFDN
ncbi:putative pathogenesis associated protein Cap20 [Xylona heveae TC161]|uniref:Putative pathogenesis associated protein Cap20 n=1 Tax=Xylona heveae (strain CBS 132557 / TC161) TaxID=1328760 RepID=A0A165IQX8_XYLHT|nr:putative pathogenesis associated protein Cap20 [Xylona heveae TC161]KZF25254.1 putative pathogenesis associated protein Cap20 [Xylona heveae TC161]